MAACSFGALDGFSGGDAGALFADDGASPQRPSDAGPETSAPLLDGSDDGPGTCDSNARITPTRAFDLTPAPAEDNGPVCNIDEVLVDDGKAAGLDRTTNIDATLAGQNVSSCIGVELAGVAEEMVVRLKPTPQACTVPCAANCGSGHSAKLFAGTSASASDFEFLREIELGTTSLADYTVDIDSIIPGGAKFLAICRAAWGPARDDIAVDAVYGRCR
jgi:hypothetical protein